MQLAQSWHLWLEEHWQHCKKHHLSRTQKYQTKFHFAALHLQVNEDNHTITKSCTRRVSGAQKKKSPQSQQEKNADYPSRSICLAWRRQQKAWCGKEAEQKFAEVLRHKPGILPENPHWVLQAYKHERCSWDSDKECKEPLIKRSTFWIFPCSLTSPAWWRGKGPQKPRTGSMSWKNICTNIKCVHVDERVREAFLTLPSFYQKITSGGR